MNLDVTTEAILGMCNIIITYIMGILAKKFDWIESKYIPVQNLLIGIFAGVLSFLVGLSDNIIVSIVACLIGSFTAGGLYDTLKTKKKGETENDRTQLAERNDT